MCTRGYKHGENVDKGWLLKRDEENKNKTKEVSMLINKMTAGLPGAGLPNPQAIYDP